MKERVALEDYEGRMLHDHVRSHHAPKRKIGLFLLDKKLEGSDNASSRTPADQMSISSCSPSVRLVSTEGLGHHDTC